MHSFFPLKRGGSHWEDSLSLVELCKRFLLCWFPWLTFQPLKSHCGEGKQLCHFHGSMCCISHRLPHLLSKEPHLLSKEYHYITVHKAACILKCYVNIAFPNHRLLEYIKSLQISSCTLALKNHDKQNLLKLYWCWFKQGNSFLNTQRSSNSLALCYSCSWQAFPKGCHFRYFPWKNYERKLK